MGNPSQHIATQTALIQVNMCQLKLPFILFLIFTLIAKSQGTDDDCAGAPCGKLCGFSGVCDDGGNCVSPEENPCVQHGCAGKSCGDECLMGDIAGYCDAHGACDFDGARALNSCIQKMLIL